MTAAEQLEAKRAALQQADAAIVAAEKANDVPGLIAAQKARDLFRDEIGTLQVQAQREAETDARTEAVALARKLRADYERAVAKFAEEAAGLDDQLRALTPVVAALFERWSMLDWRRRELGVVVRRFELPDPEPLSPLPGTPDVALAVFDAAVRSNVRPAPAPIYGHIANMTPEQKHAADVVALAAYVRSYAVRFSPETKALFARVPAPEAPQQSPEARERVEQLDRQAAESRRMRQRAAAEEQAMAAIRNFDTPEAKAMREEKRRQVARAEAATRKQLAEEAERMKNMRPGKGLRAGAQVPAPATNKKGK